MRPHVIGKGGEIIKRIQEETRTKVTVPKMAEGEVFVNENDGTTIQITIEGDFEGTTLARRRIETIAAERVGSHQFLFKYRETKNRYRMLTVSPESRRSLGISIHISLALTSST